MIAHESLGLALVHFVWQGLLVAAALFTTLRMLSGGRPQVRYAVSVAALVLMAALPALTLGGLEAGGPADGLAMESGPPESTIDIGFDRGAAGLAGVRRAGAGDREAGAPSAFAPGTAAGNDPELLRRVRAALQPFLGWIVGAWALGVLALSMRLLGGWVRLRRVTGLEGSTVPETVRDTARHLAARLAVSRPVRLARSARIAVPAVVGWMRPVILLPASALTGLTPPQLEAILAHELAHIRRHDYLVNLFQAVVETLLFYHPAVWWVSGRIREEREHCCDDLAVAACGDRRLYAGALLDLETLRAPAPRLAMAADGSSLVTRVRRLLDPDALGSEIFPRWSAALSAATIAVAIALACGGNSLLAGPEEIPDSVPGPEASASGHRTRAMVFIGEAFADKVFRYRVTEAGDALLDHELTANVSQPGGIAFSPWGEMFVSNRTGSLARFLDPEAAAMPNGLITAASTGAPFGTPHWLTFRDDELLVAQASGTVLRFAFDRAGNASFNGTLTAGSGSRGIQTNPTTGEILVSSLENSIHRFAVDASGDASAAGRITGGGMNLHGMAFTPWGELLVADYFGDRVTRFTFDAAGNAVANGVISGGDMAGPIDLDFSPWGELFVTNHNQVPGVVTRWTFTSEDVAAGAVYRGSFTVPGNLGGIQFAAAAPNGGRRSAPE